MSGGGGGGGLSPGGSNRELQRKSGGGGVRQCNILLVGQSGSGKTALTFRAADGSMPPVSHTVTVGVDFKRTVLDIKGEPMALQLWDSSGHERFTSVIAPYYKTCNGVMVAYDVSDRSSFDHVSSAAFKGRMKEQLSPHAAVMLVATKCDKADSRAVSLEEGRQLAASLGWAFIETSAMTNVNVVEALTQLATQIVKKEQEEREQEKKAKSPTSHPRRPSWVSIPAMAASPAPIIILEPSPLPGGKKEVVVVVQQQQQQQPTWTAYVWERAKTCCCADRHR